MREYPTSCFINRELSWLDFNERILDEARDRENALFERLKFLSITASNLDEFVMVRIASLKDMVHAGYRKPDFAGMSPKEQLEAISEKVHGFYRRQYTVWNRTLMPLLPDNGLVVVKSHEELDEKQKAFVDTFFEEEIFPVLTPMAVDSSRPFPLIRNKSLNIGAILQKKGDKKAPREFATVQVPTGVSRIVFLPSGEDGERRVILLEEVIKRNMSKLFLSYNVLCRHAYRIMRNADLSIDEDEADDLLAEIEKQVHQRQWGEVIRLEVESGMDAELEKILRDAFQVNKADLYQAAGPVDLTFLMKLYGTEGFEHLKQTPYEPKSVEGLMPGDDIFKRIREGDVLLQHPYQSFLPVIEFVRQAAVDPKVLAIKQTLYRVSGNSPIIAALAEAAENGKQVSVLVELKARFDEENNITWAKMLEKAGCHVIYGLVGLKTHSKITLVVRREADGIRRYVHLSTGNYNDSTAKQYTDIGMFTCSVPVGQDATAVFNMLSGYSEPESWNRLVLAPIWLKERFLAMIRREKENVERGGKGHIIAKMNALCDRSVIEALYDAAQSGVKIDLIIRGICSLRAGMPGISENITVRSIVGRYLEHSRIYYFYNDGEEEYFLSSADWMPRNLERRVEILFPVDAEELRKELKEILETLMNDTLKARIMQSDGSYKKVDRRGKTPLSVQQYYMDKVFDKEQAPLTVRQTRTFTPRTKPRPEE